MSMPQKRRWGSTNAELTDDENDMPESETEEEDSEEEDGDEMEPVFNFPDGLCVDTQGNIYVSDGGNHRIMRVQMDSDDAGLPAYGVNIYAGGSSGEGFADGDADGALFSSPAGMAIDFEGNLIVADQENSLIRKIRADDCQVTTVAGCQEEGFNDGPALEAMFSCPVSVACDHVGNIYVVDGGNHKIRRIDKNNMVSTFAGGKEGYEDGAATAAKFRFPSGIAIDRKGNIIVADYGNHRIRMISPDGIVSTVAGSGKKGYQDGHALSAMFSFPQGIAVNPVTDDVIVADYGNEYIRSISFKGKEVTVSTLAGTGESGYNDGEKESASFNQPRGVACDVHGNVYVADRGNHAIRVISPDDPASVKTVAGSGEALSLLESDGDCEEDCEARDCCPPAARRLSSKRAPPATTATPALAHPPQLRGGSGSSVLAPHGVGGSNGGSKSVKSMLSASVFGVLESEGDDVWGGAAVSQEESAGEGKKKEGARVERKKAAADRKRSLKRL